MSLSTTHESEIVLEYVSYALPDPDLRWEDFS